MGSAAQAIVVIFLTFLITPLDAADQKAPCPSVRTFLARFFDNANDLQSVQLEPVLVNAMNESLPAIEESAYKVLEVIPGTPGFIRFNEIIDEALRDSSEYPAALLKLAVNRLPYLRDEPTIVFLSGGVADPWAPLLQKTANEEGLKIKIVKLPGSLSFARGGNQKAIPEFPDALKALLKDNPAIFLDDTYTNGGTAAAVREAVQKVGGKLDGTFVVYEGGKGDPASLYKTGRNNKRNPSMGNFPEKPKNWRWNKSGPRALAIELEGTLIRQADPNRLTTQGEALLVQLEKMGGRVQFLKAGRPVEPLQMIRERFNNLQTLGPSAQVDFAIGNWGRDFRGLPRSQSRTGLPQIETVRIGDFRDEGILSEDLLDRDYFLNRLSEMGVIRPEYARGQGKASAVDKTFLAELDLRNVKAPLAERGSHQLEEIFKIEDPKTRVARLSKIQWGELTDSEQELFLERAPALTNSFEIGQAIRIAGTSSDPRWEPILSRWLEQWKDIQRGWQTFVRADAEKSLLAVKNRDGKTTRVIKALGKQESLSAIEKLTRPLTRWTSKTPGFEVRIPPEQITAAKKQIDREILDDTFFIVPNNDGEASRALDILYALEAPHIHMSKQKWGATLDKESLPSVEALKERGVKRIAVFEIPGPVEEEKLRKAGFEVIHIDHHSYQGDILDRRRSESSLEQLMSLINWPMSRTDEALAVNDRGYIPGLKKMALTEDEIRQIRKYDLIAQGRTEQEIDTEIRNAHALIPKLPQRHGVYILDRVNADEAILRQELAIQSKDGLVSTLAVRPDKVGFSGNPEIAQKLLKTKFENFGYESGSFDQYGGGDPQASMFFGFKPTKPPKGETELIPGRVLERMENLMKAERPTPLDPAKGEIHYKLFGNENPATIVLIHGLDSATFTFDSIVPALSKKYRVVVYDQRGHGQSAMKGSDYSTHVMAKDLKALLDHLGIKNAHVLGHSMGGRTAARFAEMYPDRVNTVIIEDMEMIPRSSSDPEKNLRMNELADQLDKRFSNKTFSSREALAEALRPYYGDEAESLTYRRARQNLDGTMTLLFNPGVSYRFGHQANTENLGAALSNTGKPVLFIRSDPKHGTAMSQNGVEAIRQGMPNAKIALVPGSGHTIHRSHADEFIDLVANFAEHQNIPELAPIKKYKPEEFQLILKIEDPKERVSALGHLSGKNLSEEEVKTLLENATSLTNSYEIGQYVRLAGESEDRRWIPILDHWIESWANTTTGWQGVMRNKTVRARELLSEVGDESKELKGGPLGLNPMALRPTHVASIGTEFDGEVRAAGMLPRGSAIVTNSGDLSQQGIRHIIHAASGSMTRNGPKFDPSLEGVTSSVKNSLTLAKEYGHKRVAVPFIGGKIFVDRIGIPAQELANQIVDVAIQNRAGLELRFVTFGDEDTQLFRNALSRHKKTLSEGAAEVTPGSITDFRVHGASAIINAANMEVQFGGGLSGAIARATGHAAEIDAEAQAAIRAFYKIAK
jgi:esterase